MQLEKNIQKPLYEAAISGVESVISQRGVFSPFGLVMLPDNQIRLFETSEEFSDFQVALDGLITFLIQFHEDNEIIGSVICGPVIVPSIGVLAAVILDIEGLNCQPVRVMQQILDAMISPRLSDEVIIVDGENCVF